MRFLASVTDKIPGLKNFIVIIGTQGAGPLPLLTLDSASSCCPLLPRNLATTGVSATVGGKRTGDSALCAAYAMAAVPTFSLVALELMPTLDSSADTSTPAGQHHGLPIQVRLLRAVNDSRCNYMH